MKPALHITAPGTTLPLNGLPANSVVDAHVALVHEYTLTKSKFSSVSNLEKVRIIEVTWGGAMIHAQFLLREYGEVPEVIEAEEVVSVASAAQVTYGAVDAVNPA
jgi:hypothetical protein